MFSELMDIQLVCVRIIAVELSLWGLVWVLNHQSEGILAYPHFLTPALKHWLKMKTCF